MTEVANTTARAHQPNLTRFAIAITDGKLTLAEVRGQTTPAHFARIKEVVARITAGDGQPHRAVADTKAGLAERAQL